MDLTKAERAHYAKAFRKIARELSVRRADEGQGLCYQISLMYWSDEEKRLKILQIAKKLMQQMDNSKKTEKALQDTVVSDLWREASLKFVSGLLLHREQMITDEEMAKSTELLKAAALAAFIVAGRDQFNSSLH